MGNGLRENHKKNVLILFQFFSIYYQFHANTNLLTLKGSQNNESCAVMQAKIINLLHLLHLAKFQLAIEASI